MATSKINNPMAWKLAGTATADTPVNMPTEYNEIMLAAKRNTTYFYVTVPKAEIPTDGSNIFPRFAFYYSGSVNEGGYFSVNKSNARLGQYVYNSGNNGLSTATFKLYYR